MSVKRSKLIIVASVVVIFLGMLYFKPFSCVTLENFKAHQEFFTVYVNRSYSTSVLAYSCIYALMVVLALPFGIVLNLIGGFLFGVIPGTLYAILGATIGSTLNMLAVRHFFGKRLQARYAHDLKAFNKNIKEQGAFYLLALQVMPITPYGVINILAGLANVPLHLFIPTTVIGAVPATALYMHAGKKLSTLTTTHDIISPSLIAGLCALSLLALTPALYNQRKKSCQEKII